MDQGGGAFYGPKIDVKIKDALGREWQMSTIQFDFNMSERFDLAYIAEDGKEHRPYMVHRGLLGSMERFFGCLVEHYAGAFPFWLAPEQARVMPITDNQLQYAQAVLERLRDNGIRADLDKKADKIGAKIRRARGEKVPYMLILGQKEVEAGTVSVRTRTDQDLGAIGVDDLLKRFLIENVPGGAA